MPLDLELAAGGPRLEALGQRTNLVEHPLRSPVVDPSGGLNGKQEAFWATLEGRLMVMLESLPKLSLEFLNEATQAWSEIEYNRAEHREIKCAPVDRFARAPDPILFAGRC